MHRCSGTRGRTLAPSEPASATVAVDARVRRLRGVARRLLRRPPDRRVRSNPATAGSHASTMVLSPGAAAPSAWMPSSPARRLDRSASPSGRSASESVTPICRKPVPKSRARRATDAIDERGPHLLQERSRRLFRCRLEGGERRVEATLHVHAVVGVPDRRVELREEVPLLADPGGRLDDPAAHEIGIDDERPQPEGSRHRPGVSSHRSLGGTIRRPGGCCQTDLHPLAPRLFDDAEHNTTMSVRLRSDLALTFGYERPWLCGEGAPISGAPQRIGRWSPRCSLERWSARACWSFLATESWRGSYSTSRRRRTPAGSSSPGHGGWPS